MVKMYLLQFHKRRDAEKKTARCQERRRRTKPQQKSTSVGRMAKPICAHTTADDWPSSNYPLTKRRQMSGTDGENQYATTRMSTISRRKTAAKEWRKWRKPVCDHTNPVGLADCELSTAGSCAANRGNSARSALDIVSPALRRAYTSRERSSRQRQSARIMERGAP